MRPLALAVRGIWWRRWTSLTVAVVGIACTATAAAGPVFADAARQAVLHATLRQVPTGSSGTGIELALQLDGVLPESRLRALVTRSFAAMRRAGFVRSTVNGQQAAPRIVDATGSVVASTVLASRDGICRHVTIRSGSCVSDSDPTGVLVSSRTASAYHLRLGAAVRVADGTKNATLTVKGIYDPRATSSRYWFGRSPLFFGQFKQDPNPLLAYADALFAPPTVWTTMRSAELDGDVYETTDISTDLAHLSPGAVPSARRVIENAIGQVGRPLSQNGAQAIVTTRLVQSLNRAVRATRAVSAPVLLVAVQLSVLTWLVLYLLLGGAAESRTSEIVLGKLRGLSARETVLHAVLEPTLIIVLAVPLGIGVADLVAQLSSASVFGAGSSVTVPAIAWLSAGVAGLGGLVASMLAATGALRRSVLDQWRGATRRPGRASWALELVVVALAAAALVDLSSVPTLGTGTVTSPVDQVLPAAAPTLFAIAAAVVAARLLPFAARAAIGPTRARRSIAVFFAVRQIGRRPADLRVFLLLALAVALATFGLASRTVFTTNRVDRASAEVGADRVVSIAAASQADATAVVDRLDPAGRFAAPVYSGPVSIQATDVGFQTALATRATVLITDPRRFARVAYWRDDFGSGGTLDRVLRPLERTPPKLVRGAFTELHVTASVVLHSDYPATLLLGLTTGNGRAIRVALKKVSTRDQPVTINASVRVPRCAAGCALRQIVLRPFPQESSPARAAVSIRSVTATSARTSMNLLPALMSSVWTSVDRTAANGPAVTVRPNGGALNVQFSPVYTPQQAQGFTVVAGLPAATPALITAAQIPAHARHLSATIGVGLPIGLATTKVHVLPRAGLAGTLLSRAWLAAASPDGVSSLAPNQIWLNARAPGDFPQRLANAGLTIVSVGYASVRSAQLGTNGPSLAITMLLLGALAAGVLAVVGATSSLLLAARRRVYELAVMRSLGAGRARVLGSLVVENAAVCTVASAVGVLAGLAGARVALARLPEFADRPAYPALLLDPPVLLCVALGVGVVVVIAAVAGIGGFFLVRRASAVRLREVET